MLSKTIDIWKNYTYTSKRDDGFRPTLDTYILKGNKKRPAVLICPGGGYGHTSEREAEAVAIKFNSAGYHAFVLYYSTAPSKHPQPLLDLSRAMCIVREHAEAWNIASDKITVCGFSAGGHLVASLGVYWNKAYLEVPGITPESNRPNALILCYPVITSGELAHRGSFDNLLGSGADQSALSEMSLEYHVSEITPPTFLWHTFADRSVPVENSLYFAQGLRKNNIPFELHIYPEGSHGLSLATEETASENMGTYPHVATWMELCIQWLAQINNKAYSKK